MALFSMLYELRPRRLLSAQSGDCRGRYGKVGTTSVQLWFQAFDQKVYTFYMKRIGQSSDYLLEVSLIEDEQLQPLLQYLLVAEKEYTFKCPDAQ